MHYRRVESNKVTPTKLETLVESEDIVAIIQEKSISEQSKYELINQLINKRSKSKEYLLSSGKTSLHLSVKEDLIAVTALLLDSGVDKNAVDDLGFAPIHYAIHNNSLPMMRLLSEKGARINFKNKITSPLHLAVKKNLVNIVSLLISLGADVRALDSKNCTPLHYAEDLTIAKKLVDVGANIRALDDFGTTPLHYAVNKNLHLLVEWYIQLAAPVDILDSLKRSPLRLAIEKNSLESAIRLMPHYDLNSLDSANRSLLFYAANKGLDKMLLWLCYYGADWTIGESPLIEALKINAPNCVATLVSISKPEQQPLIKQAQKLMEILLNTEAQAAMNAAFATPPRLLKLHNIVKTNVLEAVVQYVEDKLPLNEKDSKNCSAIHYAREQILLFLSQQPNIDLNIVDLNHESILHKCVRNEDINSIKTLMIAPKSINRYSKNLQGSRAEDLIDQSSRKAKKIKEALAYLPAKKRTDEFQQSLCCPKNNQKEMGGRLFDDFKELELQKIEESVLNWSNDNANSTECTDYEKLLKNTQITKKSFVHEMKKLQNDLYSILIRQGLDTVFPPSEVIVFDDEQFDKIIKDSVGREYIQNPLNTAEGLRIIYDLCAGELVEEKLIIDLQSIEFSSYGLLKYYSLDNIFNSLILLSPYFCNHQHLVGHALVFHLLKISLSLDLDLSKSTSLQWYLEHCCLREVEALFKKMWKLIEPLKQSANYIEFKKAMVMETPIMNKKINMSNFIQKIITDKEKIAYPEIQFIAREISQLSRGFYQKAPFDLLISDTSNVVCSNPFIKKVSILNELTAYILCRILWQNAEPLRAKAIQLFVLVAKECFLLGPDLNSLLTIMTALASPRISRLKKTWDYMAKKMPKTKEIYDLLMKWLSDELDGNYKHSRRLMERYPSSLPYLGFNFRENILISENPNKANNAFYLGKLYHYLIHLKTELEFVSFTNETNLFDELINLAIPNEDSFIKMSYCAEPEILDLANCRVELFLTNIKRSQEYALPLKIMSNSKCYEGQKALAMIYSWLKKFENDPNFDERFLYAHYKNCKNKEELFSSLYNDCKNFVENDIDMSEKAKKGSFKRLSIFSNSSPLLLSNTEKINDKEKSMTPRI